MLEVLAAIALAYLVLMGWLKLYSWRFNRSSQHLGRSNQEQAQRDYLARNLAIEAMCAERDANRQNFLRSLTFTKPAGR